MISIKDKVIVITGASSGIGAAAAKQVAELGAIVVVTARREERLKELVDSFPDGTKASYFRKPGWVSGCGCTLRLKTSNPNSHCIINK